jgi:hypothetical protein
LTEGIQAVRKCKPPAKVGLVAHRARDLQRFIGDISSSSVFKVVMALILFASVTARRGYFRRCVGDRARSVAMVSSGNFDLTQNRQVHGVDDTGAVVMP